MLPNILLLTQWKGASFENNSQNCISIYPPDISSIRLNNILGLRDEFPDYPIGKTMDFSLIWDGYELINTFSRRVEIK